MRLFLIGFMGSGKSHTGRRLAERLGLGFVDLDTHIEAQWGMSVAGLFAREGEAGFRALEREALHSLAHLDGVVVATGGGTPCFFDNMAWMNAQGITVFLDVPVPVLVQRLGRGQASRPLIAGKTPAELEAYVAATLEARRRHYMQAAVVHTPQRPDEDVAAILATQFLGRR